MTPAPVRVLWLTKGLGAGGSERLLLEHATASSADGFHIEVAYLLASKDALVGAIVAAGVPVHCLDVRSVSDTRWVFRLRRLVKRGHFDVVHIHSPAVAALARPALRVRRHRPAIVTTEHNRWPAYWPITRFANRITQRLDDASFAVSEDVLATMSSSARARTQVLVHGVDLAAVRALGAQRGAVRAEFGVPEDEMLVVTVANLREHKDYPTLLRAARLIVDRGLPVRFVAVGQGPLAAEIHAMHDALGLGDRMILTGYRPDGARVIAGADVFALSSSHEGLPVAVMEALALGVPVVSTGVGGIPEAVDDGVSGRLVAGGDPKALADALTGLVDPAQRTKLAAGAREAGDRFDARRAVEQIEATYVSLADGRR